MDQNTQIRLVHLSDVHLTRPSLAWRRADWFTKRLPGWINLRAFGRGRRFENAERLLRVLMASLQDDPPDRIVFSGDATALGFQSELAHAAEVFGLSNSQALPGLAVPGNHDYYVHADVRSGWFEQHFARWQKGERVDDAVYPFAQRVGPYWLIAVNSAVPNRLFWDASGFVDKAQLERLGRLLNRLDPGPRILVSHYPICLANGRPEKRFHGLRNLESILEVAKQGGVCLWLHGHRHGPYWHQDTGLAGFPVICAGSATQNGHWSYGDYLLMGQKLHAARKEYNPETRLFEKKESFDLDLPIQPRGN
ncbi:MAG: metallophosphoesterase family protein [Gemmataceae bacterium]